MKKYVSTLLIIVFLAPFLIPFSIKAAPYSEPVGGWGDNTSNNKIEINGDPDAFNNYWKESYESISEPIFEVARNSGYALIDLGDYTVEGLSYLWYYAMPSGWKESLPQGLIDAADDIANNYINGTKQQQEDFIERNFIISGNSIVFNNPDYDEVLKSFSNAIVNTAENSMILYQTQSIDDIDKFILWDEYYFNGQWYDFTKSNVTELITSNFTDEDYPLYFVHSTSSIGIVSLSNISGEFSCDGLVNNNNWSDFLERFKAFQSNGYLNNLNGQEVTANFDVYACGRLFNSLHNDFKTIYSGSVLSNPFRASAYSYSEYRPTMIRNQSCIISQDGSPMIFFKDTESYLNFINNKAIIPFDFQGSNIDYTDFFNNLDQDALNIADSLSEIYDVLNDAVVKGLQDAVDRLTTTNQWLKKIYNKVDDWKKEWNIRNVVSTLTDIVGALDDLIDIQHEVARLMNNTITGPVVDNIESMIEDATLASTIRSRFPFCIPLRMVSTITFLSSYEVKPLNFSVSSNALGFPFNFTFNYESIPGHAIGTLIVRSFIFLAFLFGLYKLTIRIVEALGK